MLLLFGCTTVVYGGPRRPAEQVAVVHAGFQTKLTRIDGRSVKDERNDQRFEILPGKHVISFVIYRVDMPLFVMRRTTWTSPTSVCFTASAGREYTINRKNGLRTFEILDLRKNLLVPAVDCPGQYDETDLEEWIRPPE
jgi:hypothetical protein